MTYPRVHQIQLGYAVSEDRLVLRLFLVRGERRVAWLPRRVVGRLIQQLGQGLRQSHPDSDAAPPDAAVMALDHITARSELATQEPPPESDTSADDGPSQFGAYTDGGAYLVTEERIGLDDGALVIGLAGHRLPAEPGYAYPAEPVAGLALGRSQAHELVHQLMSRTEQAEWGLAGGGSWLDWLPHGHEAAKEA